MSVRSPTLVLAVTVILASAAVIGVFIGGVFTDPEARAAVVDDAICSTGDCIYKMSDSYIQDNHTYFPSEGYTFVIAYIDVTNLNLNDMRLSPADFKLLDYKNSQPIVYCTGFDKVLKNGEELHGQICYEVPAKTQLADLDVKYEGPYKMILISTPYKEKTTQ